MLKKAKIGRNFALKIITYLLWTNIASAQEVPDPVLLDSARAAVKIARSWELPVILKEISGIAYIDAERIACVQDEIGTIFIYNTSSKSIELEVPFGPPGDYEAIAVVNDDVYIAVADGRIIEVTGFRSGKAAAREYGTHLTVRQNVEGLCYDKTNKRLLVAIKGQEEGNPLYKGIYAFDLVTKTMPVKPVIKIDLQDPVFQKAVVRNPQILVQPSEIDIHPLTGEIYVADAVKSQLLVIDQSGKIKALHALSKSEFIHPEGIMFTPSGELFVANCGDRQLPATLMQVELK